MRTKKLLRRAVSVIVLLAMVMGLIPQLWTTRTQAAPVSVSQITAALRNLPALRPVNELLEMPLSADGETTDASNEAMKSISGKFYIVTDRKDGNSYYMLQPFAAGGKGSYPNTFPAVAVDVVDGAVVGADPKWAAEFFWQSDGQKDVFPQKEDTVRTGKAGYEIRFRDGRYLRVYKDIEQGIARNDSPGAPVGLTCNYRNGTFALRNYDVFTQYGVQLRANVSNYPHFYLTQLDDNTTPRLLRLYRILENRVNTEPLYNGIKEMEPYISRRSEFEESTFEAFLECMNRAIQSYTLYNGKDQSANTDVATLSKELEILADELRSYAMEVVDYIDIALEAYDFRADGFMFESRYTFGAPYSLSNNSPVVYDPDGNPLSRPGTYHTGENYVGDRPEDNYTDYRYYIKGLIEDKLEDGRIVYKESVVKYIAAALWSKEDYWADPDSVFYPDWNSAFYERAKELTQYGDYDQTVAKTSTGNPGGILLWTQVETFTDLAYYMLHGLWFKAEETSDNVLQSKTLTTGAQAPIYYNTQIKEFQSLRLIKKSGDFYGFNTGQSFSYNKAKGYIYNDSASRRSASPTFNIAANLGYEADDVFGMTRTGRMQTLDNSTDLDMNTYFPDKNYYYVFHASAPFIYRKADKLEFTFVGDDDVYFFINDKLVCDIGGVHGNPQRTIKLEAPAEEDSSRTLAEYLGLEDGDICSFDMFFADRHTESINLRLDTNIKMMDATVDTEKFQYRKDTDAVQEDGAVVETGTEIGYGFAMTNRMELGATNLSFSDPKLGVSLNKDKIQLNGTCKAKDLILTYRTCNHNTGALYEGTAEAWSYSDFAEKLRKATYKPETTINPLTEGAYRITLSSTETTAVTQLQNLLEIGLPANTRLEIKGMTRSASYGQFTNTLTTGCYPLDLKGDMGKLISGTASCSIYAMSLTDVKVNQKASIVMDYGKPLDFNPTVLLQYIEYDRNNIELSFVGLRTNDRNGATYNELPKDLACTAQRPQLIGDEGAFSLRSQYIRYTLSGMMEQVEDCYLFYSVKYLDGTDRIVWYVALELDLIPANMIYYEAENLGNHISFEEKSQKEIPNSEWLVKSDSNLNNSSMKALSKWTSSSTDTQDVVILGEGQRHSLQEEFLFFPFDEGYDYSSPVYRGNNFTQVSEWSYSGTRNQNVHISDGAFHADVQLTASDYNYWFQTKDTLGLSYLPTEKDCFRIRLRLDHLESTASDKTFRIRLLYYSNGKGIGNESRNYPLAEYVDRGYFELEYDFSGANYRNMIAQGTVINAIRLELQYVKETSAGGSFDFDYMYIGPKDYSYLLDPECIYMDFSDSPAQQMHYYAQDAYDGRDWNELKADGTPQNYCSNTTNTKNRTLNTHKGIFSLAQTVTGYENADGTDVNGNTVSKSTMWIQTGTKTTDYPLSYDPSGAEVVQMRFKLEDFLPLYDLSDGEEGANVDARNSLLPKAYLQYYYRQNGEVFGTNTAAFQTYYYDSSMDGKYMTVTMYLSDSFTSREEIVSLRMYFTGIRSRSASELGTVTVDYFYIGDGEHMPHSVTYGYDSSYEDDKFLSDGNSLFAQGKGAKGGNSTDYTEISFDFTGTGFDLISRTGMAQGTIRVEVSNKHSGELVKRLTMNNKGELELYQIPVVSLQGLPHDTYTVMLWVDASILNSGFEFLDRGNEFYFDALRIYDPLDPKGSGQAQEAYRTDLEGYQYIKEVRNILLSAQSFGALQGSTVGTLFVDVSAIKESSETSGSNGGSYGANLKISDHYALSVDTYNKVGPKNEVYLDPGQAVTFKIEIPRGKTPVSLDIGAKTVMGQSGHLTAAILQTYDTTQGVETISGRQDRTVNSATAMYYPLELEGSQLFLDGGKRVAYVVIYNRPTAVAPIGSRSNVLSITDIKVAYAIDPLNAPEDSVDDPEIFGKRTGVLLEEPIAFTVDQKTHLVAASFIRSLMETEALPVEQGLSHNLNLGSDIALNYLVPKAELEGYDRFYLRCSVPQYDGDILEDHVTVDLEPVERDGYYYFTLEELTAVNMADEVTARLYMEKNGQIYASREDVYSIAGYAYSQLRKAESSKLLKTLCADLLHYGARAQIYKGYRLDALADAQLTEEQRSYLSCTDTVAFGNTDKILADLQDAPIVWKGKTLDLASKISLKFVFSKVAYEGEITNLSLRVCYEDLQGREVLLNLTSPEPYLMDPSCYAFTVDALTAPELRSVVSVQIYDGQRPVSCTLQYSADTYGKDKYGTLGDLCKALLAYSDSAKAYFTN